MVNRVTLLGHLGGDPEKSKYSRPGSKNGNWKGGRALDNGYPMVWKPDHSSANKDGYVYEHNLRAEQAMGKPLPKGAKVHHVNGSRNYGPLVICQDQGYHLLLHKRERALKACGNANWCKCCFCKQYDEVKNLRKYQSAYRHLACAVARSKEYKKHKREKKYNAIG